MRFRLDPQQQALRDLDQAWRNFFAGTHRRPSWRKAGIHEGSRIVGPQARQTSTDLATRFDLIRVEDLNIKAMTRSARGTLEKPGRNRNIAAGRAVTARGATGMPVTVKREPQHRRLLTAQ